MIWQIAFVVVLVVSLVTLFWWITRSASERIVAQFRKMADRYDVELTVPPVQLGGFIRPEPFLHGTYRGREFSISVPGKGLQNTRQIETMLKMQLPEKGIELQMSAISGRGPLSRLEMGKQKLWKSGDASFDESIAVRSAKQDQLSGVLDEKARASFLKLLKGSKGTVYIGKGVITYAEFGLIADDSRRELFERAIETFCDFAESRNLS